MEILPSSFLNLPLISSTAEHKKDYIYRIDSVKDKIFKFKKQTEKGSYWEEIKCEFLGF